MTGSKLRRKIAWEAARLIYQRHETQYYRAKMRAARQMHPGTIQSNDLPENAEIRAQIRVIARQDQELVNGERLFAMRGHAYSFMQQLRPFQPRLVGPVLAGELPSDDLIDVHVYIDDTDELWACLEAAKVDYELVERPEGHAAGGWPNVQAFVSGPFRCRLSVYPQRAAPAPAHRTVHLQRSPQATLGQLRQILQQESPEQLVSQPLDTHALLGGDRFSQYQALLAPLETVQQSRQDHPEGDVLYHSLQVFQLARAALPYDEEFLLAALLHDVGKGIDQRNPTAAALESLEEWVSPRTLWLIDHLDQAHAIQQQTIGVRAHRRLQASPDFDELMLLARCDLSGRQVGVRVPDVTDALDYLRELEEMCGE